MLRSFLVGNNMDIPDRKINAWSITISRYKDDVISAIAHSIDETDHKLLNTCRHTDNLGFHYLVKGDDIFEAIYEAISLHSLLTKNPVCKKD
jgi:hypothetical protein